MMQPVGTQDTVIESALKDFHDLKLKVSELNLSAASLQKLQESKILSDLSLEWQWGLLVLQKHVL